MINDLDVSGMEVWKFVDDSPLSETALKHGVISFMQDQMQDYVDDFTRLTKQSVKIYVYPLERPNQSSTLLPSTTNQLNLLHQRKFWSQHLKWNTRAASGDCTEGGRRRNCSLQNGRESLSNGTRSNS